MCMCACVCMCLSLRACASEAVCVRVHACARVCVCMSVGVGGWMRECARVCVHVHTHACTRVIRPLTPFTMRPHTWVGAIALAGARIRTHCFACTHEGYVWLLARASTR